MMAIWKYLKTRDNPKHAYNKIRYANGGWGGFLHLKIHGKRGIDILGDLLERTVNTTNKERQASLPRWRNSTTKLSEIYGN